MNPFTKTLTREERRKIWDGCDPLLTHMLGCQEDFLSGTSETEPEIVPARPLTLVEKVALDNELARTTLFGGIYRDREYSSVPGIAGMQKAEEKENLEKLLGRQPRVQSSLDAMIAEAIQEALTKRYVPGEHFREPLQIRTGGRVEYDAGCNESTEYSSSGAFLRSWAGGPNDRPAFENMATR